MRILFLFPLLLLAIGAPARACVSNAECSDGNACNGAETCQGGVCTPGTPPNCVDANPCTADACDTGLNHCVHIPVTNGISCADSNLCNGTETCQGGVCTAGAPLDCS